MVEDIERDKLNPASVWLYMRLALVDKVTCAR